MIFCDQLGPIGIGQIGSSIVHIVQQLSFIDFPFAQFVPLSIRIARPLSLLPPSLIHRRSSLMGANYTPANRLHMSPSSSSSAPPRSHRRSLGRRTGAAFVSERTMIVVIRATRVEMDGGARERGSSCDICPLLSLALATRMVWILL